MDLSAELRDRRKAAGRTIASVAVDAGLSVPYIANLENGRGNPTLAALARLATALGTRLELTLVDLPGDAAASSASGGSGASLGGSGASGTSPGGSAGSGGSGASGAGAQGAGLVAAELVAASPRATAVIAQLAATRRTTRRAIQRQLVESLDALAPVLPAPPTDADLNRLLDLLLLAG